MKPLGSKRLKSATISIQWLFRKPIVSCRAQKRLVNSQKYGVDLVRFTHAKNAAIHASTKRDDAIRYLSLHDNKVKL